MKLVMVSDSHNLHRGLNVPDGDVFIHAGDLTIEGKGYEVESALAWMKGLPHKYKILVPGNHDFLFERRPEAARNLCGRDIILLMDQGISLEGVNFWGMPWQPRFFDWAFNADRGAEMKKHTDLIPDGTDVLITHGPPMGYLDMTPAGEAVGCFETRDAVNRVRPKVHVFGHIHYGRGELIRGGTNFFNATVVDEAYRLKYEPFVFEL